MPQLPNTAKVSDIISSLQASEGINQKVELSAIIGSPTQPTDDIPTQINNLDAIRDSLVALTNDAVNNNSAVKTNIVNAVNAKFGSGLTASSSWADVLNAINAGSNIKSIQTNTYTWLNTTSVDIPINSVDLSKAIVLIAVKPMSTANEASKIDAVAAKLTSTTNINLSTITAYATTSFYVTWTVIEFNNVKSLQRGSASLSAVNVDIPITAVNPLKTLAFSSAKTGYTSGSGMIYEYTNVPTILNSTTLRITSFGTYTQTAEWQVIEFN